MSLTLDNDNIDPNAVKQGAQLLFERVAGQRRKTECGFKDQWRNFELAFATFCYLHVSETHLGDLCHNIRAKFGAGVDREFLKALAEAACRENKVWDHIIDTNQSTVYTTLNEYIEKLRRKTELIEKFVHVQDMFKIAERLGKLTAETVSALSEIDVRLFTSPISTTIPDSERP
ncbi:hypothetical protein F5Y03DRAFT_393496 [Xylaria venustula]|nr:hypothetical protein F5Y03DRAFT_393496 [Xylaria venustula]